MGEDRVPGNSSDNGREPEWLESARPKILIVDDSTKDLQEVKSLLGYQQYDFFEVRDPESTIWHIVNFLPDLVILDAETMGQTGLLICYQIRTNPKTCRTPILVVSTRDVDKDALLHWLEAGAEEYIFKPFHVHELRSRVRVLVRLKRQMDELEELKSHFEELSLLDALTGLHNRRYLVERMTEEFARAQRHETDISVLMMDIDHFKAVNDQYGHQFGDIVLKELARILSRNIRHSDLLARYGGEEFVAVLFETRQPGTLNLAERIRRVVQEQDFSDGYRHAKITISIGVYVESGARLARKEKGHWENLISRADEALYVAKAEGRNCVRLHDGKRVITPIVEYRPAADLP